MTAPYFRVARKFMGPAWLTSQGDSELIGFTLDLLKDAFVERLRKGLLARLPQNDPTGQTTAPDDALAAMGRDRRIVRGINETSPAYAARLIRWLDDWAVAGNPFALLQQLAAYLGPGPTFRTVDVRGNWYSRDVNGVFSVALNRANWDWDGSPTALANWSRFWLVIYPNGMWQPSPVWGTTGQTWGAAGKTWGTTATPDVVSTIQTIVAQWKPAGTICVNVIVAFDNTSFNPATARDGTGLPNGTWGNWGTIVNGALVPGRLATASYWDGA